MNVTEQVQESEKPQPVEPEPVVEPVVDPVVEEDIVEPQAVVEHEELPLPEEVNVEETSPEEWQAEAETVEIVEAVEEEAQNEPQTDRRRTGSAGAGSGSGGRRGGCRAGGRRRDAVEEMIQEQEKPTKEGFFARLKRSLLKTKENLGSGFISLFRGKKIDDDLFEELEEQLLIADVGVETTRKIIANLTEGASRNSCMTRSAVWPAERRDGRYPRKS
ncbi:cell division protein [Citrobacter koseri]|nr:cell division protein [Citrobacter koseri]